MRFPFVSRVYHEATVNGLRKQIIGLARVLYPNGVPEEFQLLLGVEIPTTEVASPVAAPAPTPSSTDQAEEEEAERIRDIKAELRSRMRTRPSTVGPFMEQVMRQTTILQTRAAHPSVAKMFAQAESEVTTKA